MARSSTSGPPTASGDPADPPERESARDGPDAPGGPTFWKSRVTDMSRIIDRIDDIIASVPDLAGRVDTSKIAVAGHSLGGQTAGMLLGARVTDPNDPDAEAMWTCRTRASWRAC